MPAAEVQTQGGEVQGLCLEIGVVVKALPCLDGGDANSFGTVIFPFLTLPL